MFEAFDAPDGMLTCSRRNESTTAPQSLALLNSRFMMEQARGAGASKTRRPSTQPGAAHLRPRPPRAGASARGARRFSSDQTSALGSQAPALHGTGAGSAEFERVSVRRLKEP